jgi:hypothetical protein
VLTRTLIIFCSGVQYAPYKEKNNMETTLLVIGNLIELLVFIGIPLVLVIKNPKTTLSLIKAVFALLVSAGKFIAPFIMPFLIWMSKQDTYSVKPSSSDDGSSETEPDWRYDYPTKRDNYKPYQ